LCDEQLSVNAERLGIIPRKGWMLLLLEIHWLLWLEEKDCFNAIVINSDEESDLAWDICLRFRDYGLLAKPTHGNKIRFATAISNHWRTNQILAIIEKKHLTTLNKFILLWKELLN
jgi:ornithine--oxo-acid transaminase